MTIRLHHLPALVLCMGAAATATVAQVPSAEADFEIAGFRHAKFGMSEADARVAIARDFPGVTIAEAANAAEGTRLLQVSLARLEPGPGPATVTYILGARSKAVIAIKLAWLLPASATPAEREGVLAAGLQLAAFFQNAIPKPPLASPARETGPQSISLYAAVDRKNAAVEIAAYGVNTGSALQTAPSGPAILRVTYSADASKPDILVPVKAAP